MLTKLLRNDLKKNMRWLWILFVGIIAVAGITRGCQELGESSLFFKILAIFFDSVYYALAVNVILQPFLRNFLNFTKSFYSDEAYLTHTLPVNKNHLITSKYITAVVEITLGFLCVVASLMVKFATPNMFDTLKLIISMVVVGDFSLALVLVLFVWLVIVEFLMFISIIYCSIVIAYRAREKRVLKTFLITMGFSFVALGVLSVVMFVILLANGLDITSQVLTLSSSVFMSVLIAGIAVYSVVIVAFYFLTRKLFNQGVNVD